MKTAQLGMITAQSPSKVGKSEKLFENLMTVPEFMAEASKWLRRPEPIARNTVYKWVRQGMPKRKIRGELYFSRDEVALWLTRS